MISTFVVWYKSLGGARVYVDFEAMKSFVLAHIIKLKSDSTSFF